MDDMISSGICKRWCCHFLHLIMLIVEGDHDRDDNHYELDEDKILFPVWLGIFLESQMISDNDVEMM